MNGVAIGTITKKWSGLIKEFFTDADNFGVSFPKDLDVHLKASLLAATMLIVSSVLLLLIAAFASTSLLNAGTRLAPLDLKI